jgi:hypothetical protein
MSAIGGGFNGSLQHRAQSIGRAFEAQGLSRTLVQAQGDLVEMGLGDGREIGSFREVLAQQAVCVLVTAALPGTARVAEVNPHIGGKGEAFMGSHLLADWPLFQRSQSSPLCCGVNQTGNVRFGSKAARTDQGRMTASDPKRTIVGAFRKRSSFRCLAASPRRVRLSLPRGGFACFFSSESAASLTHTRGSEPRFHFRIEVNFLGLIGKVGREIDRAEHTLGPRFGIS